VTINVISTLCQPNRDDLYDQIKANATLCRQVLQQDSHLGKRLTIVGAGSSLAVHHGDILPATEVWACNSALPYLVDRGLPVTHGFCIDQGPDMLKPSEWGRSFDVDYLLASSVYPALAQRLTDEGHRVTWFHNYLGLPNPEGWIAPADFHPDPIHHCYEFWLYCALYPPAPQAGYGLNSVVRAVCLGIWMGFKHITVLGADCAAKPTGVQMPAYGTPDWVPFLKSCVLYADGRTAFDAYGPDVTMVQKDMETRLGDLSSVTRWHTRSDMVISAQHLANLAKSYAHPRPGVPTSIQLLGNTLPNAMMDKPRGFFDTFPRLNTASGVEGFELVMI